MMSLARPLLASFVIVGLPSHLPASDAANVW
jgi:hypothetical protein